MSTVVEQDSSGYWRWHFLATTAWQKISGGYVLCKGSAEQLRWFSRRSVSA